MEYIPYFQYGRVKKLVPPPPTSLYEDRGLINDAERIVSDGKMYDLTDIKSIYSIPVPDFGKVRIASIESPVLYLEYVLRMHASFLWKREKYSLALACLAKSTQIMLYSPIGHSRESYYRIVDWHEELGKLSKAAEWERWIEDNVPKLKDTVFERVMSDCRDRNNDLVYTSWAGSQSAATAKYQCRVYSISGKDRRFPALPDFMKQPQDVCFLSGTFRYWGDKELDTLPYRGENVSAVSVSWRPFVDDRTEQDKANHEKWKDKIMQPLISRYNTRIYYRLKIFLPELLPKSRAAFNRIAAADGDEYAALIDAIKQAGIPLPEKPVYVEPVDPEPDYKGGHRKPFILF